MNHEVHREQECRRLGKLGRLPSLAIAGMRSYRQTRSNCPILVSPTTHSAGWSTFGRPAFHTPIAKFRRCNWLGRPALASPRRVSSTISAAAFLLLLNLDISL